MSIRIGDVVTRKSYGNDILFTVTGVNKARRTASLQGVEVRLMTDAPFDDLRKIDQETLEQELNKNMIKSRESIRLIHQERKLMREKNHWQQAGYTEKDNNNSVSFELPGAVLHLDGDGRYLEKCLSLYDELGIHVDGFHMAESEMPMHVGKLLHKYHPDILILTGHDAYRKSGRMDLLNPIGIQIFHSGCSGSEKL